MALVVKNLPANAGDIRDTGLIPGSGRSPGEGNGNILQYSCLENPMDRGAWQVHRVAELDTTEATQHAHTQQAKKLFNQQRETKGTNIKEVTAVNTETYSYTSTIHNL